jgi:hypothetical protein
MLHMRFICLGPAHNFLDRLNQLYQPFQVRLLTRPNFTLEPLGPRKLLIHCIEFLLFLFCEDITRFRPKIYADPLCEKPRLPTRRWRACCAVGQVLSVELDALR